MRAASTALTVRRKDRENSEHDVRSLPQPHYHCRLALHMRLARVAVVTPIRGHGRRSAPGGTRRAGRVADRVERPLSDGRARGASRRRRISNSAMTSLHASNAVMSPRRRIQISITRVLALSTAYRDLDDVIKRVMESCGTCAEHGCVNCTCRHRRKPWLESVTWRSEPMTLEYV